MQEMAKLVMLLKKRTFCVCRRDTHTHQVQIRPCQSRAKKAVTSEIPFEKSNTAVFSCASEKPDESSRRFFSERRRGSRQNFFACFRGSSWLSFAIFRNTSCLQLEILRMPKFILVILLGFTVMMSFIQPSLFMTDMMKSKTPHCARRNFLHLHDLQWKHCRSYVGRCTVSAPQVRNSHRLQHVHHNVRHDVFLLPVCC